MKLFWTALHLALPGIEFLRRKGMLIATKLVFPEFKVVLPLLLDLIDLVVVVVAVVVAC